MADYRTVLDARNRAGRVVLVGENDHYKPLVHTLRRLLAARRDRRDGVRAVRDDREEAEDGRRLAQRRDDGRRRCLLRGRHSLAAPGRQPRPGDHDGSRLPAVRVARRAGQACQEHDGGVSLRQRRGRVAVLLARSAVAAARAAAVEAVRPRRRHHVRVERPVRPCPRRRAATAAVPGVPRHPRLPAMYRDFLHAIRTGQRAADEPRAGDGRPAADGSDLRDRRAAQGDRGRQ